MNEFFSCPLTLSFVVVVAPKLSTKFQSEGEEKKKQTKQRWRPDRPLPPRRQPRTPPMTSPSATRPRLPVREERKGKRRKNARRLGIVFETHPRKKLKNSTAPGASVRSSAATQHETDPRRLEQRQKQIDFGKNTRGYQRYTAAVPR